MAIQNSASTNVVGPRHIARVTAGMRIVVNAHDDWYDVRELAFAPYTIADDNWRCDFTDGTHITFPSVERGNMVLFITEN